MGVGVSWFVAVAQEVGLRGGLSVTPVPDEGAVSDVRTPAPQFVCKCLWTLPGSCEVQGKPLRPLSGVAPANRTQFWELTVAPRSFVQGRA